MKILFAVNWYTPRSSVASFFHREQCIELQPYCDIRLYWSIDPDVSSLELVNENGLWTYRSEYNNRMNKIQWFFRTLKYFDQIIAEFKPDIIHANVAYPVGLVALLSAKKHSIHVILTEHSPIEQMRLSNLIYKWIRHYIYNRMERNICVSKNLMNRLHDLFPKAKYEVIYNGAINPKLVEKDDLSYRKSESINCVIVGNFYNKDIKGYQYLIPAIQILKKQGYNIVLHICGSGTYEEYYKNMAKEMNVEDVCIFHGQCNRKKVYSIVSQMDFCVSSSVFESAGVAIEEAMLMGKPVLVTKSGGTDSLVTDFTAIVVDRNSISALVDGLKQMINQYMTYDKDKIIEYAMNNFEISNITKKYVALYNEVLNKKG